MNTMIVNVKNNIDINIIAAAIRQLDGVAEVKLSQEISTDQIPGLPYTYEKCMTDICRAENSYAMGNTITSDELHKRMKTW
jgi:hypothetical protein